MEVLCLCRFEMATRKNNFLWMTVRIINTLTNLKTHPLCLAETGIKIINPHGQFKNKRSDKDRLYQ
jgi:hypothetical protein